MKEIPLTQGKVAIVDDEDYDFLMQWKWYAYRSGEIWYAQRTDYSGRKPRTVQMHRVILNTASKYVDHHDHNGLNNQRSNLRPCTHAENHRNRRPQVNNVTSKYKGVSLYGKGDKYVAKIKKDGKQYHLGYFTNEAEAARAYDAKARELFGEFCSLNFMENVCKS